MTNPEDGSWIKNSRWAMPASLLLALAFFVYAWMLALVPLGDSDLWFHLKNGQYILETHSLPGPEDPYGFTLEGKPLEGGRLQGLRSQWLGQVVLYTVYNTFGPSGLSAFRALLALLPFMIIVLPGSLRSSRSMDALLRTAVVGPPVLIAAMFLNLSYERPQAFSFFFACVVLVILNRLRQGDRLHQEGRLRKDGLSIPWLWAVSLPAVMVLWSNMHGGYIIGVFIISLWAAGELLALVSHNMGFRFAKYIKEPPKHARRFFIVCLLGILAAGLNPGGFLQVRAALGTLGNILAQGGGTAAGGPSVLANVLEYKPLLFFYQGLGQDWPLFTVAFYAISIISIALTSWFQRRLRLPEVFVAVFVVWFGLAYFRGVLFALPALALIVTWTMKRDGPISWKNAMPALAMGVLLVTLVAFYGTRQPWRFDPEPPAQWISGRYPEEAIGFMRQHDVRGPLFNYLGWGGYLIWKAWPDYRVFVDGREIDPVAFGDYVRILQGARDWREILDSYGINTILVPVVSSMNGAIFPIISMMAREGDRLWRPVYLKNNTVLLVRDSQANAEVLECCAMAHERLYRYIADYSALLLINSPGHRVLLESRAAGLLWSGQPDEIAEARRILLMLPDSPMKRSLLKKMPPGVTGRATDSY